MRICTLLIIFFVGASGLALAQMPEHLQGKVSYPVLDQNPWIGVIDWNASALPYDSTIEYKVMVDVYDKVKEPSDMYAALGETARTYNLLAAHGVPKEKIQMAVIVHGGALDAFFTNEAYQEKFRVDNPNMALIKELSSLGVKFYVCSQSMAFRNIPNESMCTSAEIALSAKTSMILLDQHGYSYLNVNED